MVSPNPSPPSQMGNRVMRSLGRAARQPLAMARAASCAERVPLYLSGATRIRNDIECE